MPDSRKRVCLFIAPLKDVDTVTRERSQDVFESLVTPACLQVGYFPDYIVSEEPGTITNDIFERILNAKVIVADLTSGNFSVGYELALAHLRRKCTATIIQAGHKIPYDVRDIRTIQYDYSEKRELRKAVPQLVAQLKAHRMRPLIHNDNPIVNALRVIEQRKAALVSNPPATVLTPLTLPPPPRTALSSPESAPQQQLRSLVDLMRSPEPMKYSSNSGPPTGLAQINRSILDRLKRPLS